MRTRAARVADACAATEELSELVPGRRVCTACAVALAAAAVAAVAAVVCVH